VTTVDLGDRVNVRYFAYAAGVASTATMALVVTAPDATTSSPAITFTAPNQYDASFTASQAGVWYWVWTASGLVVDVETDQITATDPGPTLYASLAQMRDRLNMAPTNVSRDEALTLALSAASRAVEQFCDGRTFSLAKAATARVFSAAGWVLSTRQGDRLNVDDIGATTGLLVEVGDGITYTTLTDAETYPDNALARGDAITAVVSPNTSIRYQRKVRVTARWGWPGIPAAVEQATLLKAVRLYRRFGSPEGVAGSTDWGLVHAPNEDPDVKALLGPYVTFNVA
jgi:hypothetical protein